MIPFDGSQFRQRYAMHSSRILWVPALLRGYFWGYLGFMNLKESVFMRVTGDDMRDVRAKHSPK